MLRALNSEVRTGAHIKADERPLLLRAPIAALESQQGIGLELYDTPGPNEAGQEHLRQAALLPGV